LILPAAAPPGKAGSRTRRARPSRVLTARGAFSRIDSLMKSGIVSHHV